MWIASSVLFFSCLSTVEVPEALAFTGICFDRNDDGYFVDRTVGTVYLLEYGPDKKPAATPIMGIEAGGTPGTDEN